MSKELYFTDGNNEVKYLDTTASFNLAITQDGSAFDLTNATAIDVKVANDTGYVFTKSIDMATIKQPLAGLITMPVDAEVMNALVPDDYTIEVWVTLSSLITPGSQEGLTDTSTDGATTNTTASSTNTTTPTTTATTTYNAIFPSDDPQGFTITENVMSDSGDVIPVMSLDEFQQEFDQLKTDLTNQVSTLQGPKGDTGQGLEIKGKVDTTSQLPATASEGDGYLVNEELYVWTNGAWKDCGSLQGPQGVQGKTGTGVSSTTIQYQIANSATTTPTGTWSNTLIATTQVNPFLWTQATLNYDDGTSKSFYLVSSKGDKGDKGDTGATGPVGPPGPVGAGLVVKGTVSNASQLPTTGNQEGYCYFVGTDLYVWDAGAWKNCGNVSPDLSNYVTVTDLNNGLSAKQDKIGYTPADDSKVVHDNHDNTITANGASYDLSKSGLAALQVVSSGSFNDLPLGSVFARGLADSPGNSPAFNTTTFYSAAWGGRKVQIAIADNTNLMFFRTVTNLGGWKSWTLLSDDSKVAHLSGANNFDTTPTVNNNPLLLASSLPSDLARTSAIEKNVSDMNAELSGGLFFNTNLSALNSPFAGNAFYYQVISGVWSRIRQIAYADINASQIATRTSSDSGKTWTAWVSLANTNDVTTAINTATANMVDSTKATNFTAGLQSGGVDVATAADLKSVADKAWYRLDFGSDANLGGAVVSSYIVYQIHDDEKYLSFFYLGVGQSENKAFMDNTTLMDLSSIVKGISSIDFSATYAEMSDNSGNAAGFKISGTKIITSTSNHWLYISPKSIVSLHPLNHDDRRIYYTELV